MDARVAATLQFIAQAFASSPTKYSVTVAPHPSAADCYDVLFSLPTAEAPESPAFVKLTLHEKQPGEDGMRFFDGLIEAQRCPIPFSIDQDAVLHCFPHASIDVAWEHKECVSQLPLWTK